MHNDDDDDNNNNNNNDNNNNNNNDINYHSVLLHYHNFLRLRGLSLGPRHYDTERKRI